MNTQLIQLLANKRVILISALILLVVFIVMSATKAQRKANFLGFVKNEKRHVFLDLGANIGDSAMMFVDASYDTDHPLKGYGSRNGTQWIIHSFEANPVHNPKLDAAHQFVKSLGHEHYVYKQTAAWINNEKMTFYLDTVNVKQNFWGASLHKEHNDAQRSGFKNITVDSVDIAKLIKQYDEADEIVLKIDIEGSEFPMLEHLIKTGSIFLVDIVTVEFHEVVKTKLSFEDNIRFYKKFFKVFGIKYIPWYLGHDPFHN